MKLYFFDQTEWIAAKTEEEALAHYIDQTGCDEEEMKEIEVKEVPESEWESKTIKFDEEDENGQITMTFKEYLSQFEDSELPLFVASTEC